MEDNNKAIVPDHRVCEICNDDGKCLNNELNPNYDEDMFGAGDIYDCVEYQERKENASSISFDSYLLKTVMAI